MSSPKTTATATAAHPHRATPSDTGIMDAEESSVTDAVEARKPKFNGNIRKRVSTADQALRARQILRFLGDKQPSLSNHRQQGHIALKAIDADLAITTWLAGSSGKVAGEEKWMHSWEKSPGMLSGYIKIHLKKWIEKLREEEESNEKEQVVGDNGNKGDADGADDGADDERPPEDQSRGSMVTNLDKTTDTVTDTSGSKDSPVNNITECLQNLQFPKIHKRQSTPLADVTSSKGSKSWSGGHNLWPSEATGAIPGTFPEEAEGSIRPSKTADAGAGGRSVQAAARTTRGDLDGSDNYFEFAVSRAVANNDVDAATSVSATPPTASIDPGWYAWYRASRGHGRRDV